MGSSISRIYDDFDDYQALCNKLDIHDSKRKAIHGMDSFYNHAESLLKDEKYKDIVDKLISDNSYLYNKFI